ncbi:polysaccharide deacetylase family protein [Clostridium sp.]|uniref:polysaccharide deacetylase family protein n=1 Tax=Clostridium sp. TaxID=1506 RepID=UPI002FC708C0
MNKFHVLMYHEIIKTEDFDTNNNSIIKVKQDYRDVLPKVLFCFLEEFEKQMEYLYENGYTTLKLEDVIDFYYNNKSLPEKSVLLTFDDMYKSVLMYAYPILKKYKFNAVGFVVLDWLFNESHQYSSRESVCQSKEELDIMRDVFQYANHTNSLHTRKDEKTAFQTIDKSTFNMDILECEDFVDVKNVFAYPFGGYTQENIQWLKELGFLLGFTSSGGENTKDINPLELNRNGVLLHYDLEEFKNIFNS